MNASARTARRIISARRSENRGLARPHTLNSHCLRAGLEPSVASGVAGALRAKGKSCGIAGSLVRMFRRNAAGQKLWRKPVAGARRYTRSEFLALASAYSPRAPKYVSARQHLLGL